MVHPIGWTLNGISILLLVGIAPWIVLSDSGDLKTCMV